MAFLSHAALVLGALLLAHAAYSAREHSALLAHLPAAAAAASASHSLPLDIVAETLLSLVLILPNMTALSQPLRPIRQAQYAAAAEHGDFKGARLQKAWRGEIVLQGPGHEEGYGWLDKGRRRGFLDVRAQRTQFADWMRAKES